MSGKFLLLQVRPEDEAADDEFRAFLKFGGLDEAHVERVRTERQDISTINPLDYCAVIVGGGPYNISDSDEKKSSVQKRIEAELFVMMKSILKHDVPYFGACYGLGLLAKAMGGIVSKEQYSEAVGAVEIQLSEQATKDSLFESVPKVFEAFVGHKESVQAVPKGACLLASSSGCPVQMLRVKQNIYACQFHPELDTEGITLRINTYRHAGYFKPEDADALIEEVSKAQVNQPTKILRNFVKRYTKSA